MLQLKNLSLMYSDLHPVLSHASVILASPGRYALMGASGSGKTTLLKAIAGLIMPSSGVIYTEKNKRIGMMFQEDRLLPWCTVLKNVMLAMPEPSEKEAKKILFTLEIEECMAYPSTFSGGMKRRVALARAIAYEADILLMDEPFSGMDVSMKLRIVNFVKNSAPLIIFSTHDQDEVTMMEVSHTLFIENRSLTNLNINS